VYLKGGGFAEGQVYVALSRADSPGGLQVINFNFSVNAITANPMCVAFNDALDGRSGQSVHDFVEHVHDFVEHVPMWFDPLLSGGVDEARWLELFEKCDQFKAIIYKYHPRDAESKRRTRDGPTAPAAV